VASLSLRRMTSRKWKKLKLATKTRTMTRSPYRAPKNFNATKEWKYEKVGKGGAREDRIYWVLLRTGRQTKDRR
jgi:hypothetical protein